MSNADLDFIEDETEAEHDARIELAEEDSDEFSRETVDLIISRMMIIIDELSGIPLYPYQQKIAKRIVESLVIGDGATITALQARQCLDADAIVFEQDGSALRLRDMKGAALTGVKPTKRYRLRGGAELVMTDEHLVFSEDGIVPASRLRVGDKVSMLKYHHEWAGENVIDRDILVGRHKTPVRIIQEVNSDLAKWLGYFTTDGSMKPGQSAKFTNTRRAYLDEFAELTEALFDVTAKWYEKGNGFDLLLTSSKSSYDNRVLDVLHALDWDHKFPKDVFRWDPETVSDFVNRAWSGDGCITMKRKGPEVFLACGNEEVYAAYWQALLLKFGVTSQIKREHMPKGTGTFHRLVLGSGEENLLRFFQSFGLIYGKEEQSLAAIDFFAGRQRGGGKGYSLRPKRLYPSNGFGPDGEELVWSKIVSIEDVGEREVWDPHVPGKGWVIAGGFQVSNSGKSEVVANTIAACMVMLPLLAKIFPDLLGKFSRGFWVGCFAPTDDQPLALDTLVPTPTGWTTIGDLSEGDEIITQGGGSAFIEAVSEVFHDEDCYEITFADGQKVVATGTHRWPLERRVHRSLGSAYEERMVTTEELFRDLSRGNKPRWRTPKANPWFFLPKDFSVDPYLLGLWLGDGSSANSQIALDKRYRHEVEKNLLQVINLEDHHLVYSESRGNSATFYVARNPGVPKSRTLKSLLREIGVLNNKHIPMDYLRGSIEQRYALLQGLIDSDGHVEPNGLTTFTQKSDVLTDGVCELLTTLGYTYHRRKSSDTDSWRVQFMPDNNDIVARLEYKQERVRLARRNRKLSDHRSVRSVVKVPSVPTRCLNIDTEKHTFLVGERAIPTRNAEIVYSRIVARITGERALEFFQDPDIAQKVWKGHGNTMHLSNGSLVRRQTAHPRSNIEGRTYHLMLVDECQDADARVINKSIAPMGASTLATMIFIGTPSYTKGAFFNTIQKNKRQQVKRGARQSHFEVDWKEVSKFNKNYEKFVKGEMLRIGEDSDEFRLAYRLHWLLDKGMFTTSERIEELGDKSMELVPAWHKTPVVVGIDVARKQDSTIVTVVWVDWDHPDEFGLMEHRILNWKDLSGLDWESQYAMIVEFLANYRVFGIAVDEGGLGDPVIQRLKVLMPHTEIIGMASDRATQSKRWKHLMTLMDRAKIGWPAHAKTRRLKVWKRFSQQMEDLELHFEGPYVMASAPKAADAHDDYADSLALACIVAKDYQVPEVEVSQSQFYG